MVKYEKKVKLSDYKKTWRTWYKDDRNGFIVKRGSTEKWTHRQVCSILLRPALGGGAVTRASKDAKWSEFAWNKVILDDDNSWSPFKKIN